MQVIPITAPWIAFWLLHHFCFQGIAMDVATDLQHSGWGIDDRVIISFLENMSGKPVLCIIIIGIPFINKGHYFGKRLLGSSEL